MQRATQSTGRPISEVSAAPRVQPAQNQGDLQSAKPVRKPSALVEEIRRHAPLLRRAAKRRGIVPSPKLVKASLAGSEPISRHAPSKKDRAIVNTLEAARNFKSALENRDEKGARKHLAALIE